MTRTERARRAAARCDEQATIAAAAGQSALAATLRANAAAWRRVEAAR
jgi:hypothetical protein